MHRQAWQKAHPCGRIRKTQTLRFSHLSLQSFTLEAQGNRQRRCLRALGRLSRQAGRRLRETQSQLRGAPLRSKLTSKGSRMVAERPNAPRQNARPRKPLRLARKLTSCRHVGTYSQTVRRQRLFCLQGLPLLRHLNSPLVPLLGSRGLMLTKLFRSQEAQP